MRFQRAFLPSNGAWYTPFCRWGGSYSRLHPLKFAAEVTREALAARQIEPDALGEVVVGYTIPSEDCYYAGPWMASLIGAEQITGASISQSWITATAALAHAAAKLEAMDEAPILVVLADKTSNGPHLVYANPADPSGKPATEDFVWKSFGTDPCSGMWMIKTAERLAKSDDITRQEQDEAVLVRHQQYLEAQATGRYAHLVMPGKVNPTGKEVIATITADEGLFPISRERVAALKTFMEGGVVHDASQADPADGNAGMVVATRKQAERLGPDAPVQILSYAQARADKGFIAKAVVPAARKAMAEVGIGLKDVTVIKTDCPLAINDVYFSQEFKIPIESFNPGGSSVIFGHAWAPTGARLIAEGIEETRLRGGGYLLFVCGGGGDTGAAMVLKV